MEGEIFLNFSVAVFCMDCGDFFGLVIVRKCHLDKISAMLVCTPYWCCECSIFFRENLICVLRILRELVLLLGQSLTYITNLLLMSCCCLQGSMIGK